MNLRNKHHWGVWIEARAASLGMRRRKDLAEAVDVTTRQLDRWLKSADMPSMHSSNARSLARALCMQQDELSYAYTVTDDPKSYPLRNPPLRITSGAKVEGSQEMQRQEIVQIVALLSGASLEEVWKCAHAQLQRWQAERIQEIEMTEESEDDDMHPLDLLSNFTKHSDWHEKETSSPEDEERIDLNKEQNKSKKKANQAAKKLPRKRGRSRGKKSDDSTH